MATSPRPHRTSELIQLTITPTVGITSAVVLVIATGLFAWASSWKIAETLTFFAVACAAAGQIAVALYTLRLLRFTIESQEAANTAAIDAQTKLAQAAEKQEKTRLDDAAGRFGERWTDASMFHARKVFDELLEYKSNPAKVSELIKADKDKETNVKNVLNFLEQLSFWVITGKCSEIVARDLFGGIVITIWHATEDWIKFQRAHRGRPQLWAQLESLYARWK